LLVGGLPGTGKSSLARWLADHAGFQVIRSDVVRKEHAQLSTTDLNPASARARLYSPEMTEQTYAECLRRAEELVFEGKRVIVDATFREEARRRQFLDAARQCGVPSGMLLCQADPGVVRERLVQRKGDASDADWSVYEALTATWEDPGERTRPWTRVIDTGLPVDQAAIQAGSVLREWELLD
jgi:predicted kinase